MLETKVNHFTKSLSHKLALYVQICSFMLFLFVDGMLKLFFFFRELNVKKNNKKIGEKKG